MAYQRFVKTGLACPPGMSTEWGDGTAYGYPGRLIQFCVGDPDTASGAIDLGGGGIITETVEALGGGSLPGVGPQGPVTDKACGGCRPRVPAPGPTQPTPTPTAPGTPGRRDGSTAYPWWLWVLGALTLAQVVRRG